MGGQFHYNFAGLLGSAAAGAFGQAARDRGHDAQAHSWTGRHSALAESLPGFSVVGWYGVMAPPNLPRRC